MSDDRKDIIEEGLLKELNTLEIVLTSKVEKTAITLEEYINLRLSQGVSEKVLEADLLKDLEEGGRIFGEFRNALKSAWAGSTGRLRDVGELAELGLDGLWKWCAVLVNTCPDCVERHNQVKTWNEWEMIGLPRTNATVCEQHCKCVVIPAEIVQAEPVKRVK